MNKNFYITYADLPLSDAPRAWVEVDAKAIRHNYRTVAAEIAKKRKDCAFSKRDEDTLRGTTLFDDKSSARCSL